MEYNLTENTYFDKDMLKEALNMQDITASEIIANWKIKLDAFLPQSKLLNILYLGAHGLISSLISQTKHTATFIDMLKDQDTSKVVDFPLPFKDENFDLIVVCNIYPLQKYADSFYLELYRLLQKGGAIFTVGCIYDDNTALHCGDIGTKGTYNNIDNANSKALSFDSNSSHFSGDISDDIYTLQRIGFYHCKKGNCYEIYPIAAGKNIFCITAHKALHNSRIHIPQLNSFNKHIKTTRKQIQLYQSWCQFSGISYTEYSVLHMVFHHKNGAKPSGISSALVIPKQTLSKILSNLEKENLVVRKKSEQDKRSFFICITNHGKDFFEKHHNRLHLIEEKALQHFTTSELVLFNDFNQRLLKSFEQAFDKDMRVSR